MTGRLRFSILVGVAAALCAVVLPAATAFAQGRDTPRWLCRASAATLQGPGGNPKLEPLVADGRPEGSTLDPLRQPCDDDQAGADLGLSGTFGGSPGSARGSGAFARTAVTPDFAETHITTVSSEAGLANVAVRYGSFSLTATAATAKVTGQCQDRSPAINTEATVTGATINGQAVVADGVAEQLGTIINGAPLFGRVRVIFKERFERSNANGDPEVVQRAIRVSITDSSGAEVFGAVVGEASVARHLNVCDPPPFVCPSGSTLDLSADPPVCVIRTVVPGPNCPEGATPASGDRCIVTVVLGPPGDQGSGGSVRVLGDVRGAGPCRRAGRAFGTQIAIVGSNRGDRITGSNRSDRIFVFAGNDRVSGGRGNDCIEGGRGSDKLDGSNGTDYLFGDSGNDLLNGGQRRDRLEGGTGKDRLDGGTGPDILNGGKGNDRIFGGPGNDRMDGGAGTDQINTGNGRDRVRGGSGNDSINAATAGPPARIDCGPGFDTVRINYNERRRLRNCERVFIISLRR